MALERKPCVPKYAKNKKMKNRESGFTLAEALLTVLFITVAVVVGMLVQKSTEQSHPSERTKATEIIVLKYSGGELVHGWTNVTRMFSHSSGEFTFTDENGTHIQIFGDYVILGSPGK